MEITAQTCVPQILSVLVVGRYVVVHRVIIFTDVCLPPSLKKVRYIEFFIFALSNELKWCILYIREASERI